MAQDMQDNLEKFVQEHLDEFDDLNPREVSWKNIDHQLDIKPPFFNQMIVWKVAAILFFVFTIGLTLFINRDFVQYNETAAVIDKEFVNTKAYYISLIDQRQQLIKRASESFPEIGKDFESDWVLLDQNYKKLKKEYKKDQTEELRNALVFNLRARVSLLNRQIEVLKQINKLDNNIFEL